MAKATGTMRAGRRDRARVERKRRGGGRSQQEVTSCATATEEVEAQLASLHAEAEREATRRLAVAARSTPPLSALQRRLVRAFPPLFRLVGDAARWLDRPLRDLLQQAQWMGRAAREPS